MTARIILRRLAFTGPDVAPAHLALADGLNVIWGASNTGKSFLVKALDFMTGAGPERLPPITETDSYDRVWLDLELPGLGQVQVMRALKGGDFALRNGWGAPDHTRPHQQLLNGEHRGPNNWSATLLSAIGVGSDHKIAKTLAGEKSTFSFRFFAPYVFVEETEMLSDTSAIRISDYANTTLDKNALKFILTGVDDSAVVKAPGVQQQRTGNAGKLELIEEMLRAARAQLSGPEDQPSPDDAIEAITEQLRDLQGVAAQAQRTLDQVRSRQVVRARDIVAIEANLEETSLTLSRFAMLDRVYDSDTQRMAALLEGSEALLAGGGRACPVCGASVEHQRHDHGVAEIEGNRRAIVAELGKIERERADLLSTIESLNAQAERLELDRKSLVAAQADDEREIRAGLPAEAETRRQFEELTQDREGHRARAAVLDRIGELEQRKQALTRFTASRNPNGASVGVEGAAGYRLSLHVQAILDAWKFPGAPKASFDPVTHEILINGKPRRANGKGVRALMHSAFKLGILRFCRAEGRPHPGFVVLDSPLLSYREPHTSRHGALTPDEEVVKASGLKDHFYAYLVANAADAQYVVIENDPPTAMAGAITQIVFAGVNSRGDRAGLLEAITSARPGGT